jgi:hypothetical protein
MPVTVSPMVERWFVPTLRSKRGGVAAWRYADQTCVLDPEQYRTYTAPFSRTR